MRGMNKLFFISFSIVTYLLWSISTDASAGVTAFDTIATVTTPVKLKAFTKGRFFSEGGKLVEFYIDEQHIGTTLSGGDGYAFLKYTPQSKGLKKIKLKVDEESDEALLLITDKEDRIVLISIETGLFDSPLSFKPAQGAKEAVDIISKKYSVIYLSSMIGIKQSRKWLKENRLHESIVFSWTGINLIEDLREKDINLYAIVASPDLLADIEGINKFSFKEGEHAERIESWDDMLNKLQ